MNKLVTNEMPPVRSCGVTECAYNVGNNCHAKGITVGDSINPDCDTFWSAPAHTKESKQTAGVGACKVAKCRFNKDYECSADGIKVGYAGRTVQCLTFQKR